MRIDRDPDGISPNGIAFIVLLSISKVKSKCNDNITFTLAFFRENRAIWGVIYRRMRRILIRQTIHLSPLCYNILYSLVLGADLMICAGLNEHGSTEKSSILSERDVSTSPRIRSSWIWNIEAWPGFSAPSVGIQTTGKVLFVGSRGGISKSRDALYLTRTKGKKSFLHGLHS